MNQRKGQNKKKKVVIAMSGGVDSSVSAALLKKSGFDVIGAFMKFWSPAEEKKIQNKCCSSESESRARQVAKILGIPFYVFNFEKKFKKEIVDSFLKECKEGKTPNPCVVCNKFIKFGALLDQAKRLGVDFLATGHYAMNKNGKLFSAKDKNKDQSYFLWRLSKEQLSRVLFPIGGYTRAKVEEIAKNLNLPFAGVKKSMEVCFIPKTAGEFLKKYLKPIPGGIIDMEKKIIGRHKGLPLYTIGQRRGMELSGGPYYVIGKNIRKNELIVSKDEKDLLKKDVLLKNISWVSGQEPKMPLKVFVKIRYRSPSVGAVISKVNNKRYMLTFYKQQRAATPGQSAVFYKKEELLGGGIIC